MDDPSHSDEEGDRVSDRSCLIRGSIHIVDCQGFFKFFQGYFVSLCKAIVDTIDVSSTVNKCLGVDVLSVRGSQYVGGDSNLLVLLSSYNYIANLTRSRVPCIWEVPLSKNSSWKFFQWWWLLHHQGFLQSW